MVVFKQPILRVHLTRLLQSKYAEQILEAHKKRLLVQQSREERKQQKEREAEAGQFDDKEVCCNLKVLFQFVSFLHEEKFIFFRNSSQVHIKNS